MAANMGLKRIGALFMALLGLGLSAESTSHAAGQGTTTGVATFQAKGEVKEYKPSVIVWSGNFVGVSVTDARKGPLHNSGWECTGESVLQDGKGYKAGGFCLVTDPEGDTINLLWERMDVPGAASEGNNKGTYLSGTGKYAGIQGHYKITCRLTGALALCNLNGGEYKIP
jgi:hypothetical protein